MIPRCMLVGMAIGTVVELVARALRLWLYRNPIYPVLNVLLVFGVVMGGLASVLRVLGSLPIALIAFGIGLAYETANLRWLHWWSFPGEGAATGSGRTAVVAVLSVLWAVVPLVTVQAAAQLHRTAFTSPTQSPMDRLNEREQQLLRKLDELQQRTRAVEKKLEEVRSRKQHRLDAQAARRSGRQAATPTP